MHRDVPGLARQRYDLLVIGGGLVGAFAALDAAQRGLSVALVDRGDWGGGASANSLRVLHGGLRYLSRGKLGPMRESIRERRTLLRLAPALARPLPFLVATSGSGMQARATLGAGLLLNDLLSADRNGGLPPAARIPRSRLVSRTEAVRLHPALDGQPLTGGALWYDGLAHDAERLTLAVVQAAVGAGAAAANYLRVDQLLLRQDQVHGAAVTDMLGGGAHEIEATLTLDAAGPGGAALIRRAAEQAGHARPVAPRFALAVNVVTRRPPEAVALGVHARATHADDPMGAGSRYLFLVPWRRSTTIGTAYFARGWREGESPVREGDLATLIGEANGACPALDLALDDVTFFHWGLLPLKVGLEAGPPATLAERAHLVDHTAASGLGGVLSAVSVKLTTARALAKTAIDAAVRRLRRGAAVCRTGEVVLAATPAAMDPGPAEVRRAVREEMAQRLSDVVFRRTALGGEGCPAEDRLAALGRVMAEEVGWSPEREREELATVRRAFGLIRELPT